jgi:hypothetical protein
MSVVSKVLSFDGFDHTHMEETQSNPKMQTTVVVQ